jgi:hypothetical protein
MFSDSYNKILKNINSEFKQEYNEITKEYNKISEDMNKIAINNFIKNNNYYQQTYINYVDYINNIDDKILEKIKKRKQNNKLSSFEKKKKIEERQNSFVKNIIKFAIPKNSKIIEHKTEDENHIYIYRKLHEKLHMVNDLPSLIIQCKKTKNIYCLAYHQYGLLHRDNDKPALIFCNIKININPIELIIYYQNNLKIKSKWFQPDENYTGLDDFLKSLK